MIEIPLANGMGVALVDDDDAPLVVGRRWRRCRLYAATTRRASDPPEWPANLSMHRLIMGVLGAVRGTDIDHINHDGLDNRRANLRFLSHALNGAHRRGLNRNNASGHVGVSRCAWTGKWRASVVVSNHRRHLGRFDTPERAAAARREWLERNGLGEFYV